MINDPNCFDQPVRNNIRTYENIKKNSINQGNDYATDCLLVYPYFKENYKLMVKLMLIQKQYNKLISMDI